MPSYHLKRLRKIRDYAIKNSPVNVRELSIKLFLHVSTVYRLLPDVIYLDSRVKHETIKESRAPSLNNERLRKVMEFATSMNMVHVSKISSILKIPESSVYRIARDVGYFYDHLEYRRGVLMVIGRAD